MKLKQTNCAIMMSVNQDFYVEDDSFNPRQHLSEIPRIANHVKNIMQKLLIKHRKKMYLPLHLDILGNLVLQ